MKDIINWLTINNKTISTMESCTGGAIASAITDIEGASEVLKFSAVTYSNEYKIKMGVDSKVIDEYTVYSRETANEMSNNITNYANSNYGVGITGQLNRFDPHNITNDNNVVYISIYDKDKDIYIEDKIKVSKATRKDNKEVIINLVIKLFKEKIMGDKNV